MKTKQELGQFFTTNSDKILQGFEGVVRGKVVMDPFAGSGDLLKWAEAHGAADVYGYDIDRALCNGVVSYNDSLRNIPHTRFNITNPPWLAKNRVSAAQKKLHPMGEYDDLYLLSMKKIIDSDPHEGIIIVPVNFFSADNSNKLRKEFLNKYSVARVNYFREQVFADTTYNVVAFHYTKKTKPSASQSVEFTFYPDKTVSSFLLEEKYDYKIAGKELDKLAVAEPIKIVRLTKEHIKKNKGDHNVAALFNDKNTPKKYRVNHSLQDQINQNIILLSCVDSSTSKAGRIKAEDITELGYKCLVGGDTRNFAYLFLPGVSVAKQKEIIARFNRKLNSLRKKYNSLFLTNFRDNDRKRASFEFCYKLLAHCYKETQKEGFKHG